MMEEEALVCSLIQHTCVSCMMWRVGLCKVDVFTAWLFMNFQEGLLGKSVQLQMA